MQTLFIIFGIIVVFLLILILSILGGIQKSLVTYLMLSLRGPVNSSQDPLKLQKKGKKKEG